jgi:tetratricopeptide (TPR) repeat protein
MNKDFDRELKRATILFKKDTQAGILNFENLLEIFPSKKPKILFERHFCYIKNDQLGEALDDILEIITVNENCKHGVEEWFYAAMLFFKMKNFKETIFYAEKCIEQSIEENSISYTETCYLMLSFCQYKMGKIKKSREYLSNCSEDAILFLFGEYDWITKSLMQELLGTI